MATRKRNLAPGTRIDEHITVLGMVDAARSEPVYLVWDHRSWCPMACKYFGSVERADREAAILRALEHPNIVRCLGTGATGYLLMEFLEGPTLRSYTRALRGQRLPVDDAIRIAIYLGSALIHMHGRGFLHLDVKPSNVIIFRNRPVLFDLDIARGVDDAPRDKVTGTPTHMAPEQCLREPLTPAADVFGLGVTVYECLTGELPYPEGRGRGRYPQVKSDAPPLRTHLPRVRKELADLVDACIARDPAARPRLDQLLPALHAHIDDGPKMWPEGFNPGAPPS